MNTEALRNRKCPKCGSEDMFWVTVKTMFLIADYGIEDQEDSFDDLDDENARCANPKCWYVGKWREFYTGGE